MYLLPCSPAETRMRWDSKLYRAPCHTVAYHLCLNFSTEKSHSWRLKEEKRCLSSTKSLSMMKGLINNNKTKQDISAHVPCSQKNRMASVGIEPTTLALLAPRSTS